MRRFPFPNCWLQPASPFNLALFRIAVFATLFFSVNVPATVWFASMPPQLRFPPAGLHWISAHVPVNPATARACAILLLLFSALAAAGLLTRFCAIAATSLALYVLGLPNLYGKVNHVHHHLIWFAALMSASPCADVLSLDAVIARRRAPHRSAPAAALQYALPLRFTWLLLGLIYFFPGFWKLAHIGPGWALPENVKYQLYLKWSELGGFTPIFPIDEHPSLCLALGAGTIAFEVSFIFLVWSRRFRPWLALAGLAFHNFTYLFMRISFAPLQTMYVALFNWAPLFRDRAPAEGAPSQMPTTRSHRNVIIIVLVGSVLVVANFACGVRRVSEAWPFACYPLFDFRAQPQRQVLTLRGENSNGEAVDLNPAKLSRYFPSDRERGLEESILRIGDPARQAVRLRALWQLWLRNQPELRGARDVRFYRDTISTVPGAERRLLQRQLLPFHAPAPD